MRRRRTGTEAICTTTGIRRASCYCATCGRRLASERLETTPSILPRRTNGELRRNERPRHTAASRLEVHVAAAVCRGMPKQAFVRVVRYR